MTPARPSPTPPATVAPRRPAGAPSGSHAIASRGVGDGPSPQASELGGASAHPATDAGVEEPASALAPPASPVFGDEVPRSHLPPGPVPLLDRSIIVRAMARVRAAVRPCYERELARNPSFSSDVRFVTTPDRSGASRVRAVTTNRRLERCLNAALDSLPAPETAPVIQYPFLFSQSGATEGVIMLEEGHDSPPPSRTAF